MSVSDDATADIQAVKRAINTLARTERMVRTYPVGNQLSQNLLRELRAELADIVPVDLQVRRDQLVWNDVPLLDAEEDRSDIAGRLYADGVRILRLTSDIGSDELERFIVALSEPIHPDDLSEDYVTRLWEAELPNVRVVAIDPYPDLDVPDEVLEGKFVPTPEIEDVGPLPEGSEEELEIPPPPEEAFQIAPEDTERIAREVEHLTKNPPWSTYMIALFDLLRDETRRDQIQDLVALLEAMFQRMLRDGRVDMASELLLRIRTDVPERAAQGVREALFRMGHPDRLQSLQEALESGLAEPEGAERVFVLLGEWVPEAPCSLLSSAQTERTRRFYAEVLIKIGDTALEAVLQHTHTAPEPARPHFVRVLGKLRDPRATELLFSLSKSGTTALRREALRALALTHPTKAKPALERAALGDADADVRLVALKCLASLQAELDLDPLIGRISSSDARALSDEELDLLYLAIGATNRPEALRFLGERLRPGWLRGRSDTQTWTRAASALAHMQLPDARQELEALAQSGKRELAEICANALEQAERAE